MIKNLYDRGGIMNLLEVFGDIDSELVRIQLGVACAKVDKTKFKLIDETFLYDEDNLIIAISESTKFTKETDECGCYYYGDDTTCILNQSVTIMISKVYM